MSWDQSDCAGGIIGRTRSNTHEEANMTAFCTIQPHGPFYTATVNWRFGYTVRLGCLSAEEARAFINRACAAVGRTPFLCTR